MTSNDKDYLIDNICNNNVYNTDHNSNRNYGNGINDNRNECHKKDNDWHNDNGYGYDSNDNNGTDDNDDRPCQ